MYFTIVISLRKLKIELRQLLAVYKGTGQLNIISAAAYFWS